jgi:acetyltransferase-like isoleucine patch superfamily enzyme
MSIGKYTYGFHNITILWSNKNACLKIGNFCSIATNIVIYLGGNHRTDLLTTYPFGHIHQNIFTNYDGYGLSNEETTKGDVIIGNDVWIGSNVTIMSGITIGDGSIIAANSHVTKNIEPYSIVGGNPARLIRYKFEKEQIEKLLKIKWWEWDDNIINDNLQIIFNPDINIFINKFYNN